MAARRKQKSRRARSRPPQPPPARALEYKVVELSNVDERTLERTVNDWVPQGWTFDGVQFAMRESSKRPAMAFVFFTREGAALPPPRQFADDVFRTPDEADAHLRRLARGAAEEPAPAPAQDPWARLEALAEDDR